MRQRRSEAAVELGAAATTVTSCVAEPVSASWFARFAEQEGRVHLRAGRAYLDRSNVRRGMAVRGALLVRAFAAAGWLWGGRWTGSPDYQHFSATGG